MIVTTFNYIWYHYHNQNKKDTLYLDTLYATWIDKDLEYQGDTIVFEDKDVGKTNNCQMQQSKNKFF